MSTPILDQIVIDTGNPKSVFPVIYGWHYEEIGMIGDGGLYAEMIRNRNFSESGTAPGMIVENGRYQNIPRADSPEHLPEFLPELTGWSTWGEGISISRVTFSDKERSYAMVVERGSSKKEQLCGVANTGFFGFHTQKGCRYRLSVYISSVNGKGSVRAGIVNKGGYVTSMVKIHDIPKSKMHYEVFLTAGQTADDGVFLLTPQPDSCVTIFFISLFPCDTWDEGKSVFRSDIMQNMIDYKPEFLRFPGGCIVHGVNKETMYHWKETIKELPERKSSWCKWQPHWVSNGIGYHEFYELCEYLEADAMYVAPCGLVCTDWAFPKENKEDYSHPDTNVDDYIQDCLDAIEYAIGSVESYWGAKRAAKGHPKPFPLKYLSIGNEDFGPAYYDRYKKFSAAIKDRYPQLKLVANSIVGNRKNGDWENKRKRLSEFDTLCQMDYFDEHYYDSGDWIFENFDRFDDYDRIGPGLMCLELGLHSSQPSDILYESIFLMMLEKNGDLHPVFAGRPLMRNWDYVNGELNPFYYHTNSESWKTIHYYAKKLFRDNQFDQMFPTSCCRLDGKVLMDEETLFSTAGKDSVTKDLIIKTVNLSQYSIKAHIDAGISQAQADIFTLRNTDYLPQIVEDSKCSGPDVYQGLIDFTKPYTFLARSLTVMRIHESIII
ncbi:MAG: alpha-L-arabinofuranosidase [Lachnospiraceae bacterium]|nr:alpha-L-arabinofuranosidase [Lachnospiraceae bacterium]